MSLTADVLLCLAETIPGPEFAQLTRAFSRFRPFVKYARDYYVEFQSGVIPQGVTHAEISSDAKDDRHTIIPQTVRVLVISFPLRSETWLDRCCLRNLYKLSMAYIPLDLELLPRFTNLTALMCRYTATNEPWDLRPLLRLRKLRIYTDSHAVFITDHSQLELPTSLRDFIICDGDNPFPQVVQPGGKYWRLPPGLKRVTIGGWFHPPFVLDDGTQWKLPDSVVEICICSYISITTSQTGVKWVLPPNLKRITCPNDLVFPVSLEHLAVKSYSGMISSLDRFTNVRSLEVLNSRSWIHLPTFPPKLEILRFDGFDYGINEWLTAKTVTTLLLTVTYDDSDVQSWSLPPNLIRLSMGPSFYKQRVIGWRLPSSLTHLDLGRLFQSPVIETGYDGKFRQFELPSGLVQLAMGETFDHPVVCSAGQWQLPSTLEDFRMGYTPEWSRPVRRSSSSNCCFNQPVFAYKDDTGHFFWNMPEGLRYLDLGEFFTQPVVSPDGQRWTLPSHLVLLRPNALHALTQK